MERPRHIRVIAIVGTICLVLGFVGESVVAARMRRYGVDGFEYIDGIVLIATLLLFGVSIKCRNISLAWHMVQMAMFDRDDVAMKQQSWIQTQVAVR